jgi:hypothetical protein
MSKRKAEQAKQPGSIVPDDPADRKGELKVLGGSQSDHWNTTISEQVLQALWLKHAEGDKKTELMTAALSGLMDISPRDPLEAMMAAQLIAAHSATMECYRRGMIGDQTFEGRKENLAQANKLSRTWVTLLEALNRHRGKGQQKVTVEHVHVHSGGQAVVGSVEAGSGQQGGGAETKMEEQPHARQEAGDASEPPLRGADAGRDGLPIPGDGQWAMPDARGEVPRGAGRE